MQIDIKFKHDVPHQMAMTLVEDMTNLAHLFDAVNSVVVAFSDGEEERMIDVERARVPRIS